MPIVEAPKRNQADLLSNKLTQQINEAKGITGPGDITPKMFFERLSTHQKLFNIGVESKAEIIKKERELIEVQEKKFPFAVSFPTSLIRVYLNILDSDAPGQKNPSNPLLMESNAYLREVERLDEIVKNTKEKNISDVIKPIRDNLEFQGKFALEQAAYENNSNTPTALEALQRLFG